MGNGTRSFQDSEGSVYDLKENEVNDFLKDFPDAAEVKSFVAGKDTFDIPLNEVADFQKDYPDAKPLGQPVEVKKKGESTTAIPSSSLDIDKELKGKVSDKDLYDYKQSRGRGVMGQTYIEELKKKNPAIAELEVKEAAMKAAAPTAKQINQTAKVGEDILAKTARKQNETQDAYVERRNKQKKEFEQIQKDKEKGQFVANEDFITNNPIEGYTEHLRANYPDKWKDIQTKKVSGEWNRGADVEEEAKTLTEHPFAGPAMVAAMRGKAFFTGETNQADDADFYLQSNNWAAKTQQDILGDIEKTDVFKQYKTLNDQLNASPVGAQLKPINEGLEKISKSKDFLEYQTLSTKGQKQKGNLSEQDYKRYQELAKTKDVASFIELSKGREQLLSSKEGQQFAQASTQINQLQGTKEIAQYFKTSQGLQKTVGNLKTFATKFPKQFLASQIYENYQKQSTNVYKKMPVVVKSAYEMFDAATDAGMNLVGELSSGVLRVAATGYDLIGAEGAAKFTNSVASGVTQLSQDLTNYYSPSSTQSQLPFFDSYVPYKIEGQSVRLYKNDKGEVIDVRDRDGYSMFLSQDQVSAVDKTYQEDDNKPQEVGDYTMANAPAKVASTLVTLASIALVPEAGAAVGLSEKAALFSYGYLTTVNGSYQAIKAKDPLISDDAATLYANTLGLINGGLFLVTPQSLLGKKAVETGYKELGQEYITLLKNGMIPNKAMASAISKQYLKHGTEGAMFGMGIELANKGVNAATNKITGRESVDAEVKINELLESGASMFIASTVLSAARGGFRDKIVGDALYTGLKNYDKTLAEFENMANKGEMSAQDFNRMTNLMSELKPIYENLADMGEYNTQYKTALISLYAEKYQKQQQLNAMDSGEQPGVLGKAVNKVKSVLTKGPMPNRDALVKELNDIDKSIESMAIVNNPDFIVYTTSAEEVKEEWPEQEEVLSKLRDSKIPLKEKFELFEKYKKQLADKKFYKNENGDFELHTQWTLKVGKQYIFDPKSGKFLAIKGAVTDGPKEKQYTASGEEIIQDPKIIGAQVGLPRYFSQGEQYTRDQLQEKLKDPAFIADMKAGRVQVDVFNDIEMEHNITQLTKEIQRGNLQEGPRALNPGEQITPTEAGPAEVLPDLRINQLGDKEVMTEDGTLGTVERADDGNWYINLENGKSQQLPVTDNANPTETIKQLGLRLPVEQNVPVAVAPTQTDVTTPTGQEVGQVKVADDGVTFNIPEVGQVTWLKFNYTNKGELKTADVMMPDGKKLKIKDTDIVYDMAVALSNQSRARLGITPEVANGAIESIVEPIKQTFDKGMNAIYNVVVNAGDAAIHIEKAYEGELLTQQEQAAALDYIVTAASTINKIDTQNATEKQNIIEWLSEAYDQVSAAEVTMEGQGKLGVAQQRAEVIGITKSEPSAPTKQRIVKHPEISANTQRILKRVAGDQESIDALTNAIKAAYEAGTSPMEAAKQIGYAGEEYKRYLEPIIQDMKPEITEKEVKAETPVETPVEAKPREFTAEQLNASATKPVVKWASNELSMKGNIEVFDAIAQNTPELAPLMQEAKQVTEQLEELADKIRVEGYPLRGNSAEVGLGYKMPFPYRIYSQLYNSTNAKRFDNAAKAIEKFKQEVQDAKEFLANPPSEAEIAKVKALREANVLAAKQKAVSPIAPFDRDAKRRTELGNLKEKAKSLTAATSNSEAVKLLKLALGGTDAEMIKEASQLVGEDLKNTPLITVAEKVGNALMDLADKQLAKLGPAPETPVLKEEPTQAEIMAKPIAMDVLKVETLFSNNGYDISIDYDNEALITNKKTGEQVEFDQLPENMQKAAEVYGEWVSNIADMVGDPMEFVAKTRSEYEGELVPYEEVGPEELPEAVEKQPTEAEAVTEVEVGKLSTDLSSFKEQAYRAHTFNSWKPEQRAKQIIEDYQSLLESDVEKLQKKGFSQEQVSRYIDGFKSKFGELLSARGATMSSAITGGSKFPVEKNRKALDREQRVYEEFDQWRNKILNRRMAGKITPSTELDKAKEDLAKAEKLQQIMKDANVVIRNKSLTDEQKIEKLKAVVNVSEKALGELLKPDYAGRIGFADYALKNNSANIRRLKERVMELENKVSRGAEGEVTEMKFEGGVVNVDYTKDRVQIMHDEKPSKDVLDKLKSNGWRWSSIDKAWQRKITDSAIRDAKNLTGAVEVKAEEFEALPALEQAEAAMTPSEEGKPQYIEGNPVGGTAEVGQYRPEFKDSIVQYGKETKIILPDGTVYRAVYVLAPIKSVLASHDPNNGFRKTEGYPVDASGNSTNDRDYEKDNSAQTDVMRIGANPNFDLYLDLGQSVNVGPTVITEDGFSEGGSGRRQAQDLFSPSQTAAMGRAIQAKQEDFGFSEEGFALSKVPVMGSGGLGVFRMLLGFNEPYSKVTSAKFNQSEGKTKSEADTSLTFGASLNDNARAKELLFNTVGAYDTIGDFFNNLAAKRLSKDIMVKNGLVAEKDINKFFDQNGNWTATGKEIFKKGLFATLFDEDIVRLLDTEGNINFLNKIAKEMPTLATNFKLPADVNLKGEIQDAIRLQTQFQSSGLPDMNTFLRNMPIFDKPSLNSAIMWSLLDISTPRTNTFRGAIQSYTNSAEQAGLPSMFGDAEQVMGKADFMNLILNKVPYEERQIIKNAFANEGFGPRVEEQGSRYTRSMGSPRPKDGLGRYTRFGDEGQGGQGEAVGRVEEDQTEYGQKYFAQRGTKGANIRTGYPENSIQHKASLANMNGNGFLPKNISLTEAKQIFKNFPEIRFKQAISGSLFMQMETVNGSLKMFNPFTAKPYDAGRGKIEANPESIIPPTTNPIASVEVMATPPAEDVLPQAERDFKNQQYFFDFNDDVQSIEDPKGKYFGFVSAANKIRKMANLSKNEQEYSTLLNDQVRNKTAAGSKKLAELRDKIGDERATEIQNDVVNNLVEHKLGRQLKPGEYATQTSTVTVSKDKYAIGSTQIKTAADVAYIARMIEGESVENFLLYMLDENGITTLAHIGTGGIAGVYVDPKVVSDHIITFKPKKIWLAHNHPAGTMEASDEDVKLTKRIKQTTDSFGVELAGHVIVDFIDGKYIALDNAGNLLGSPTLQSEYKGAEDEIPVYINGKAATFDWSSNNKITSIDNAIDHLSNSVTALRAGENAKGGFLVLNRANVVIGHFYLTGDNDVQNVIRASSALGGSTVITYGNFNNPIYPIDREMPNGVKIIDHLTYQSERFTSALEEPEPVYDYTSVTMPRAEELVLPYDRNSSKLQQSVQQAMVDGFLKFDEVMFNLYDGHFGKDVIKMRKALDEVKDAYDNLSFENEDWIDSVSSIKEVSSFNVDNFLKSIQSPQKKKMSLRQQYDDFASWFEYNFPEARPHYKIEFDSQLGDAIFTINGEPIQKNGEPISYSRWLNNAAIQKDWYGKDKALVKNQPAMIWVDKDLTPTPKQYITDASYKLFPFQTHAVNAAIDYFEKGNRGFGLWDGQGVGKTREILAIANEMAARSGKPSLIITKSDNVIDQFKESASAMSLRDIEYKKDKNSGVIIGTYQDMVGGKVGKLSSYGTVVFDEAHLLKNIGSKRSKIKEELMQKMDHVVFATGTPMDKPSQLLYFAKYMSGDRLDGILQNAGIKVSANGVIYPIKKKSGEPLLPEDKNLDDFKIIKKGLLRWRNQMIQEGAMIRREFPFYGTFGNIGVELSKESLKAINTILAERPGKVGLMEANRYQEHLKIPYALERVYRALENGKQIVLFCTGVNPTEIKSMGITVPQFALEFSDILKKQGIAHSNIFGDNAAQKIEEAKKFQRGETKVAIATISSGGTGIDLDDQVGDAPRETLFVTLPWSADDLDQAIRRVSRLNTKSPSVVDFISALNSYPDEHKQAVVQSKMQTMRNVQAGVDPDVVEMNNWKEGDELEFEVDLDEAEVIGSAGWTPPVGATPVAGLSTPSAPSAPYNPGKEKEKAEKKEAGMLGATSGSRTSLGTSVPPAGPPRPAPDKSSLQQAKEWLLGQKRTSIQAKVLQAMIDLGVPTAGEYPLSKKYLGYYTHLSQDAKLRYAQDIFTALHETMHWIDYSVMGGLRYDLKNNASTALLDELEDLYLSLYPGAKEKHKDELKISEGLAVFMQYKLYDPDLARQYPLVEKRIFSPGGQFYHPKMTETYDAFRNILNDIQGMSSAGRVSQRIASDTPFDDKFTVSGWDARAEQIAVTFDESYPLILWDEAAGDAHILEASYLMWRRRGALAANVLKEGSGVLSGVAQPMYFAPNGQWTPLKYRMSDIVKEVVKTVKDNYADIKRVYPEMTTSLDALRTYLIARRVYYMGVKRVDLETLMSNIIADAQQDYAELLTYEEGSPEYEAKLIDFNSNHIRPLKLAAEKWKQVNTIIDNEGGSVKDVNPDFSASLLAFEKPLVHGVVTTAVYDNKKGNYISEHDVTEVFKSLRPYMDKAARMYDFINDKIGIDMAVATGLMSRELSNELKHDNALYPGYASFQKHINATILEDDDFVKLNGGGANKLRHSMRWKGSEYAIIDPLMSQASMIFEVYRKGMWNNTLLKLAQFSTLNDEFARGFMKLPTEHVPVTTSTGTYLKAQPKGGEPKGVMVLKVYSNGKVKFYAVNDRGLFHYFSSIADENKLAAVTNNKIYKFSQQLKVLFEKGTTGWYLFWPAKNLTVDQFQLLFTSANGAIPVISTLRWGLPHLIGAVKENAVKHMQTMFVLNKLFPNRTFKTQQMNYVVQYLSMSGSSDSFFKQMENPEVVGALEKMFNVEEAAVKKYAATPFKGLIRTIDSTAMALTELTEILTKATEFALAMEKGKSVEESMLDAANGAPFYKRGSGKVLRAYQGTVPYLKPQFVMFYKTLLEGYRKNPGKMMLIMDTMIGLGALSIFLLWESLTEDEKNYYRGLDGKTASMYISIPSKLLGGKEGEISQYRVPEYIGSFNALGLMLAIAVLDDKGLDQKQIAKTILSNIPSLMNPYEYVASDKTVLESAGTNFMSNAPVVPKIVTEIWSDKKISYYGRTPLTPRQTQSFPTEYQYKLGLGGTSSFAKYISSLSYNKVTPVQADLVMERVTGRTGKMLMDLFDNKELKNTFLKTREDIATNNKYYADFWSRYNDETGEFNVMRNVRYAAKIPKPGEPGYEDWKKEVRQKAETSEVYSSTHFMIMELLKMRDWAKVTNNEVDVNVYNQMNRLVQGLYENQSNETLMRDVHDAYRALKQEASRIRYESDVAQFNNYNDISKIDKYQIKLKTKKMIKGIR